MTEEQTPEREPGQNAPEFEGRATYSPEDNKLRLYIGRVPREEYLKLRAEGWKALHKQREAGGGDFVATWTPERRDTALEYAGIIEDEDMGPEERAADRAERFAGYRDKRTAEATGRADSYDAGPSAHGFQSAARAERSARRHDRLAARSVDSWDKAEYWQQRTAGVISHALYKSSPSVRMGRIKTLEAELRKSQAYIEERRFRFNAWKRVQAETDPVKQTELARKVAGSIQCHADYTHPRAATHPNPYTQKNKISLYSLCADEADPITGAEACALFFSDHSEPGDETEWTKHFKLRIAYENQMIEGQGGRAALVEMEVGGWFGKYQIRRVVKSPVTKLPVSVEVMADTFTYKDGHRVPITAPILYNIERTTADEYRPPTEEDKKAMAEILAAEKKARKASAPPTIPLVNPTDSDAEKLQAIWNETARAAFFKSNSWQKPEAFQSSKVRRIPQSVYSANSKGSYAKAYTLELAAGGTQRWDTRTAYNADERNEKIGPAVCKVRATYGDGNTTNKADSVIIITDAPQKPLPAAVWRKPEIKQAELLPA